MESGMEELMRLIEKKAEAAGPEAVYYLRELQRELRHTLVNCDGNCGAVLYPSNLKEYKAALEHWETHGYLNGCSHGC